MAYKPRKEKMSTYEALCHIVHVSRGQRQPSAADFKKAMRALDVLGIPKDEMLSAARYIDIVTGQGDAWQEKARGSEPWKIEGWRTAFPVRDAAPDLMAALEGMLHRESGDDAYIEAERVAVAARNKALGK